MNDGGPAFPRSTIRMSETSMSRAECYGMSLRDYIAIEAMPAYIADSLRNQKVVDCQEVASFSYEMADVMLKERSKCP